VRSYVCSIPCRKSLGAVSTRCAVALNVMQYLCGYLMALQHHKNITAIFSIQFPTVVKAKAYLLCEIS
jgi:hypothetical protein